MSKEPLDPTRRAALITGCACIGASVTAALTGCEKDVVKSRGNDVVISLADEPELAASGSALRKIFADNNAGKPVIIIRTSEAAFVAFSSVCTHQGCIVDLPANPGEDMVCPCHDSRFSSSDGSVGRGPAGSPLASFPTTYSSSEDTPVIHF